MLADVFFLTCGEFRAPSVAVLPPRELLFAPAITRLTNTVAVAVRESGDIVLVDAGWEEATCCDPVGVLGALRVKVLAPALQPGDSIAAQLRGLGFDTAKVTTIVATHMHLDHIGGIADFPNAELVCSQRELSAYWGIPFDPGYRHKDLTKAGRIRIVPTDGPPLHGFRASADLFGDGDVLLLDNRGHTKGTVAVKLAGPGVTYLHVGDAVYQRWEYAMNPDGASALGRVTAWNRDELRKAHSAIRDFATAEPGATIVASHDARMFERLPQRPERAG